MNHNDEGCWVSLILRLSIVSLLFAAGLPKFLGGLEGTVAYFQSVFKDSWLPLGMVTMHARLVPFLEVGLAIWLLLGIKLRAAWVVSGLFLVSLAFGMVVARQFETAAHNYVYVLIACAGLYFSRYDRLSIDAPGKKIE